MEIEGGLITISTNGSGIEFAGVAFTADSAGGDIGGGERIGTGVPLGDASGGEGDLLRPRRTFNPAFCRAAFLGENGSTGSTEIASYPVDSRR